MMLGQQIRLQRERLRSSNKDYSLRKVAGRVGVEPAYLSKIEREEVPPPSEGTIKKIAHDLELDPDVLLAMAGKISSDLRDIICQRPQLFSKLLRELKSQPENAVLKIVREITDGDW